MSEPIPARIKIGGPLPRSLVEEFCGALCDEGVELEWVNHFEPRTVEDLLAGLGEDGRFHLTDDQANYGQFDSLESWCKEHGLSFDRHSDAKYEYDGEIVRYRPNGGLYEMNATQDGEAQIAWSSVEPVVERLTAAVDLCAKDLRAAAAQAAEDLRTLFCQDVEDLPPFEIVEG